MSVVHIHGVFLIFIPFGIVCKWRETSNKRSTENAGCPNGLPNWGTFRVIQKHKGIRIIDDIVKFVNN